MRLEKQFCVNRPRDEAVERVANDETLIRLLSDGETEIVARDGDRRTTRTRYRALGREGTATFHFTFLLDGNVRFEKVCDGKVWSRLEGEVSLEERGKGTRVRIQMEGRTKAFIPEFTIRAPMQEQIERMAEALRERIESGADA